MMTSNRLLELQDEIVMMVADAININWDTAVVNVEAELIEEALTCEI